MNKMVVVTGATTGTGYCVAQKFAANGYDVCITSRDQARAQEAAARLKAENDGKIETFGYGLEVLDEPQMAAMFDDLKQKGHLVSTLVLVAANMGINKPNVRWIIHHDLPKNIEGYYQETGRAGRDGLPGDCLLLFSAGDIAKQTHFLDEITGAQEQQVARAVFDGVAGAMTRSLSTRA